MKGIEGADNEEAENQERIYLNQSGMLMKQIWSKYLIIRVQDNTYRQLNTVLADFWKVLPRYN